MAGNQYSFDGLVATSRWIRECADDVWEAHEERWLVDRARQRHYLPDWYLEDLDLIWTRPGFTRVQ
jgi:hypothetical protein